MELAKLLNNYMPRKGYKSTEEHIRKNSLSHKGQIPWNKNKKLSIEHKKKLSLVQLGKHHSPETKKKMSTSHMGNKNALGKKFSLETRKKMSESKRKLGIKPPSWLGKRRSEENRKKLSGKNNYNWKGGITPLNNKIRGSLEYKLWQDSVFARDGYACQKCYEIFRPYKLVAHHVLNFSNHIELRFAIDNGITFCRSCHKEFHKIYGKKNNTREQVDEFLIT